MGFNAPGRRFGQEPLARPERAPQTIVAGAALMCAGGVLALLNMLQTYLGRDAIREDLRQELVNTPETHSPEMLEQMLDEQVATVLLWTAILTIPAAVLWVGMAVLNVRGLPWARAVASTLAGLGILTYLFTLIDAAGYTTLWGWLISLASLALAAGVLYLLWRPASSTYYEAMSVKR